MTRNHNIYLNKPYNTHYDVYKYTFIFKKLIIWTDNDSSSKNNIRHEMLLSELLDRDIKETPKPYSLLLLHLIDRRGERRVTVLKTPCTSETEPINSRAETDMDVLPD